jgi:hypothetical protein
MKEILDLIRASAANETYKQKVMLYGQLIGSWRIRSIWYNSKGESKETTGEWHFAWILGGLGVQDVLYADSYSRDKYGITIRCYDIKNDVWHVSWMQPGNNEFANLVRREGNKEIIQELLGLKDKKEIWRFKDITETTFTWLDEVSLDNGTTWNVEQKMYGEKNYLTHASTL